MKPFPSSSQNNICLYFLLRFKILFLTYDFRALSRIVFLVHCEPDGQLSFIYNYNVFHATLLKYLFLSLLLSSVT